MRVRHDHTYCYQGGRGHWLKIILVPKKSSCSLILKLSGLLFKIDRVVQNSNLETLPTINLIYKGKVIFFVIRNAIYRPLSLPYDTCKLVSNIGHAINFSNSFKLFNIIQNKMNYLKFTKFQFIIKKET